MAWEYITPKHWPIYDMVIGDDWRKKIPVFQSDKESEFDFIGWNAFGQVRNKANGEIIIEFDSYDGTLEFEDGKIYLIADKDDTNLLEDRNYVWDCQFLDPWGYYRTLILESPFEVIKKV